MSKIRVLCVDDSALIRQMLTDMFQEHPSLEVAGIARDGESAIDKIKALKPDVVTMDVDMPKLNGLQALKRIMRECPVPVVMISSLTQEGSVETIKALSAGAVDFIPKPGALQAAQFGKLKEDICHKVIGAARANLRVLRAMEETKEPEAAVAAPPRPRLLDAGPGAPARVIIAIGISTGGPASLNQVIPQFPESSPPVLIVQHMPEGFTRSLAERLDKLSKIRVKEAEAGDMLRVGQAYIAPGHSHMRIVHAGGGFTVQLAKDAPVSGHRPSVDALFHSLADCAGNRTVAAIMTGMGRDGVDGMKALKARGARTVAQDEATSVVWGMPKQAYLEGAAPEVVPLDRITAHILKLADSAR